tara:strand:+ start:1209 stop:1853 length:645 start_codon:yes stop_codon:yes gene_type:complete
LKFTLDLFEKSDVCFATGLFVRILLASASERRGSILRERFSNVQQVALKGVDESVPREALSNQVQQVVTRKANAVKHTDEYDVIIVADTLVEDPDDGKEALGKPTSKQEATTMLLRIRGCRHRVWSATMVHALGKWQTSVEYALVEIENFSDDDLIELIESESWVGKAGGYDLAGLMGQYATLVEGSEYTVLGFTQSSLDYLDDVQSLFSMNRS